jgi:hypothetical protein
VPEQRDRFPVCEVCGRTILKGEQVHEYLTPQGQELRVCALCRSNAEASGWIPMALAHTVAQEPPTRSRRGQAIRERLGRAASRAKTGARARRPAEQEEPPSPPPAPETASRVEATQEAPAQEPAQQPRPRPQRRQERQPVKPRTKRQPARASGPAAPRKTRPRRGPEAIMRRAVERFNSSEERRKVAGLIRSLGEPHAAVRPDPSSQMALVTVAWELSWYQWEVNGDGEGEPVREIAKGKEVSELAEDSRDWNARVREDGSLRLRSSATRRKQAAKGA